MNNLLELYDGLLLICMAWLGGGWRWMEALDKRTLWSSKATRDPCDAYIMVYD